MPGFLKSLVRGDIFVCVCPRAMCSLVMSLAYTTSGLHHDAIVCSNNSNKPYIKEFCSVTYLISPTTVYIVNGKGNFDDK